MDGEMEMYTLFEVKYTWLYGISMFSIFCVSGMASNEHQPISFHFLPGVNETVYSQLGDINIGALVYVYSNGEPFGERCSASARIGTKSAQITEAIAFAVNLVNKDPSFLPNTTLGFVMRGVCGSRNVGLAASLAFLPRAERMCNGSNNTCITSAMTSQPNDSPWLTHDVIGVLGSGYSSVSQSISYLYAVAHLPLMGIEESSDDFSNKRDHPYFFRVGPPDRYIVEGILEFISSNGWSYISVVYADGSYGINAFRNMEASAASYGVCIATSFHVYYNTDYDSVVTNLLDHPRARVVVLFLTSTRFRYLLQATVKFNATGHFVWIGGDSLTTYTGFSTTNPEYEPGLGAFIFDHYTTYITDFYRHLGEQTPVLTENPWLKSSFEYMLECSYDQNTCDLDADIFQTKRFRAWKDAPMRIDAVLTFARAAHNLLAETCPLAVGQEARACITRKLFHEYLRNVSFEGYNGRIQFDENQDVKGKYVISQFVYDYFNYPFTNNTIWKDTTQKHVGTYDILSHSLSYYKNPIDWSNLNTYDRVVPWVEGSLPLEIPESVCSGPCVAGEYKIEKDVPCCWECRRCRDNERLIEGNTSCEACRPFTWPDPMSGFTRCIDIHPDYPKLHDTIPIIVNSFAFLSLVITSIIIVAYCMYRNERVIKASSRELSVFQLVAIFTGYVTAILFQTTPSDVMCGAIFFLFCMSFSLLYCPLLVKTIRIYRIFQSGAKNERPRFISPSSQLVFSVGLIIVQVTLCLVTFILVWPRARLTQPIWSEKLVELSCDLTFIGIASFLGYNIVLVSLCSVFAFMVRKLPDNFNESKFISMCVSTTLLIWLAFIPTYFTADREYIRVFLLSMALLLNHSVALFLLFVPKIIAAIFISPETDKLTK